MPKISQKLYIRVALAIALVAIAISLITASFVYWVTLTEQRAVNSAIVNQLADSAQKTSAMAAYLEDDDVAQEITNGLVSNDLVGYASIVIFDAMTIESGDTGTSDQRITVSLVHPFGGDELVGELYVVPNDDFLQAQARAIGWQNAISLVLLSFITAVVVSVFVHRRLTRPLQKLTEGFKQVDPNIPDTMQTIDIGYRKRDELGILVSGINALMIALKQNLQTERILRERTQQLEQRFRLIFEQASAGIGLVGSDNRLLTINPALKNLFEGLDEGDNFAAQFIDYAKVETTLEQMRTLEPFGQISLDLEYSIGGQRRWLHCLFAKVSEQRLKRRVDQDILIEVIAYDVTERIQREHKTRFEADHDSLTQLRNRRSGERALSRMLVDALQKDLRFIVMMIDLDKFKPVNDTYGHDVGDEVLVTISKRIKHHFNLDKDVCVRWGGDEFVIGFVTDSTNNQFLEVLAKQLLTDLRLPIRISETISCEIGGSIGIVVAPDHGDSIERLLVIADAMMYQVKHSGRDKFMIAGSDVDV